MHTTQGLWHKIVNWQENGQVNGSSKKRRVFQLITYWVNLNLHCFILNHINFLSTNNKSFLNPYVYLLNLETLREVCFLFVFVFIKSCKKHEQLT